MGLTTVTTFGWLSLMLGWMVFAWGEYSAFQTLAGLGLWTLLFAAIAAAIWVRDLSRVLVATIGTTLGWLCFALYWIAFQWGRFTLLQNGALLIGVFLLWLGLITFLWLAEPGENRG
jgi:hypothetical protein